MCYGYNFGLEWLTDIGYNHIRELALVLLRLLHQIPAFWILVGILINLQPEQQTIEVDINTNVNSLMWPQPYIDDNQ